MTPDFKKEKSIFDENLQSWIDDGLWGHYVVIKSGEIVGFYKTAEEAGDIVESSQQPCFCAFIQSKNATNMVYLGGKKAR